MIKEQCNECRGSGWEYNVEFDSHEECIQCKGTGGIPMHPYRSSDIVTLREAEGSILRAGDKLDALYKYLAGVDGRSDDTRDTLRRALKAIDETLGELRYTAIEIQERLEPTPQSLDNGQEGDITW